MSKVWFITGASSGFGRALAEAVLANGDRAVLAARRLAPLEAIAAGHEDRALPVSLDVTDPAARASALKTAIERFGRIDVLANIAGRGSCGAVEEFTSAQLREQMELNFFAAAELSREVLPQMRAQGSGHILNLTSIAGLVSFPICGLYSASKFALEGLTEALHHEVKPFGIRVTLVEPGAFRTEFAGDVNMQPEQSLDIYAALTAPMHQYFETQAGMQAGDPVKAAQLMIDVVESATPPLRLMLGADAYDLWDATVASRNKDLAGLRARAEDTAFPGAMKNPISVS
ncbi:oxidoreductase [Burkholderia sp. Ax-1719]|uniref:oxidoreductase n=1 Tax=Burkholderia sp. Ax-1719 TaxID=2608334 RepID=UPI001421801A|nr:oxidoreductase [Burkholderia sp. Ax-1719]NIE64427.1 SDR family NAD(P)-dependent oxidoreductase [Burkholderia sp. Ax-1719]